MKRPWRLTRGERVAMEWLRCALWDDKVLAIDIMRASRVLGWSPMTNDRFPDGMREWRIYRARVAIALRAALRADEDARAEEAYVRAYEKSAHAGAWWAIAAMRGWPIERRDDGLVPLALWEAAWRPTTAQQPSERPAPTDETP